MLCLQKALENYIQNPNGPLENYELALSYNTLNHYAAALSFYIRAAERSTNPEIIYNSLVLAAICFDAQNKRKFSAEGLLQHAITVCPGRPEAYFHLCRIYEQSKKWREMIVCSVIGLQCAEALSNNILQYPGRHALMFYKALGKYNIGLFQEAKSIFLRIAYLEKAEDIDIYKKIAKNNITNLGYPDIIYYDKTMLDLFKFPFKGIGDIEKNYSKHFQDMFVLAVLNGKKKGYYLEFGAGHPHETSNTVLLEELGWKGLSYDIDNNICYEFAEKRKNTVLNKDATKADIKKDLEEHCAPKFIDYLQVDIDEFSLDMLYKIPFDTYEFGIIQFEHDLYRLSPSIKEEAIKLLESKGYIMMVNNLAFDNKNAYEDWWVHPSLYKKEMVSLSKINFVLDYMLRS